MANSSTAGRDPANTLIVNTVYVVKVMCQLFENVVLDIQAVERK
jgi:hypothetical protein